MSGIGKKSTFACIKMLLPEDIIQFLYIARLTQVVFVRGKAQMPNDLKHVCNKNVMLARLIKSSPKGSINGRFLPHSLTAQCIKVNCCNLLLQQNLPLIIMNVSLS